MNEKELTPLEALKQLKNYKELTYVANITGYEKVNRKLAYNDELKRLFCIIEQAIKQAQKDKEMLGIFKSALTIEHDLSTPSFTPLEKDKPFNASAIITETIKIKQNELDEKLRKSLREWVLKNAFPKELKRLKELERTFDALSKDDEKAKKELSKEIEKNRALEIIKEKGIILQFIKETYTVEQYNAGVFGTLVKPLTQEEYNLLKEELL